MTLSKEYCSDCDRKYADPIQRGWTEELPSLSPSESQAFVHNEGRRLLDAYGLDEWRIGIDPNAKRWLGQCDRSRKSIDVSQSFIDAGPTIQVGASNKTAVENDITDGCATSN